MKKVAAIILAAGKGTRMKSEMPKVAFPIAGVPMINRVVALSKRLNSDKIGIVVGYKKEVVIDIVKKAENIVFIEQVEQNGTGHAVLVTEKVFKDFEGTVFILCGDVPLLRFSTLDKMLKQHENSGVSCTVLTALMDNPLAYGRIIRKADGNVDKIVEFKDATDEEKDVKEINTGIYCFNNKDLFEALNEVGNNNNQGEYYLTDTLEILNRKGKIVKSLVLDDMIEASGVNSREQLEYLETKYMANKTHFDN